jgi:hypothetical protein
MQRCAAFLLNLLQDVNIARPLVLMARRELALPVRLLVSDKFIERDTQGLWQTEIEDLRAETGASVHVYDSDYGALQALAGCRGVLIAASESDLSAHVHTHGVFRVAPTGFVRVTLQHGFECVGFHQNRDHYKAHGRHVGFAADVICGWCELPYMQSVAPSERAKYFATGPSALLQPATAGDTDPADGGLVCENLHSVRMRMSGDFKASFMDTFFEFCRALQGQGHSVTMRPHPGGQYVLKHGIALPSNVGLNNLPMYKVDLSRYAYGVSAPSSVVIDMVLAGIPTAVWQDEDGIVDASNYEGLTVVSTLADWLAFERDARIRPALFARRQAAFIDRSGLLIDRPTVHRRFEALLAGATA